MNVNHKLELLDQLDDAAFALMMDEYAEAEGERLRAEFEADMRAGLTPPMPEGLDEKCRKQIKAEYGRARWAEYGARARKMAAKAAAVLLIGLGIAAATVMSVEAIRIPVLNYIVTQFDKFTLLTTDEDTIETEPPYCITLEQHLPFEYYQSKIVATENTFVAIYKTEEDDKVSLTILPENSNTSIDTENTVYSEIMVSDYKAILIEKNGFQVIWRDLDEGKSYHFYASSLPLETVLEICNSLIADSAVSLP